MAEKQDYQQKSAVPLSEEEAEQLLGHVHAQQVKTSGGVKLLYIRGGLAISCLWRSTIRGFNAGSVRTRQHYATNQWKTPLQITEHLQAHLPEYGPQGHFFQQLLATLCLSLLSLSKHYAHSYGGLAAG